MAPVNGGDRQRATVWHVGGDDVHLRIPLLLALRERGFTVGAVGSAAGTAFSPHDIPYWRYSLNRWLNPLADLRTVGELGGLLRRHRPTIVHAFDTKPIILAPVAARRSAVPGCVRTVTGMGYVFASASPLAYALRPVYRRLQQWAANATQMTVFQNPDDRAYYLQHKMAHTGREALVLGSGIDTDRLQRERPDVASVQLLRRSLQLQGKLVVTMVARLVKTKGVLEFLAAAKQLRRRRDDVRFLLVGPRSSEGRQAVTEAALQHAADDVQVLGPRDDVAALLALTDVFALPSYYREGVPRALLEAAAQGLPLVTTDMPGCREVVRDDWNGYLVAPRNATALAEAVDKLLGSADRRALMGRRSLGLVEQFSLPRVADQYADIYRRIVSC